jgi:dienelactone hydrolase
MTTETSIPLDEDQVVNASVEGEARLGTVLFAHGSGSSRHSPRNRHVAGILQEAGFQTVLLDLLTDSEEQRDLRTREHRFDIALLTRRVGKAMDWLRERGGAGPIGLFGASTGAAAALRAAADYKEETSAVVSRGGRPDLAGDALDEVVAPTLLIVGGNDPEVLSLNRQALEHLNEESSLEVVDGATHLFEEPGKLDEVAQLATEWFQKHLG